MTADVHLLADEAKTSAAAVVGSLAYHAAQSMRTATGNLVNGPSAYFGPSRSPISRHGDQGFRAIAINRFGIAIRFGPIPKPGIPSRPRDR